MSVHDPDTVPGNGGPAYCTCDQCEAYYRLQRLGAERRKALAEWIANGPEEHKAARERVREIIGL